MEASPKFSCPTKPSDKLSLLSKLSLGGAQFGFPYGIANSPASLTERNVFDILTCAETFGITRIDTAVAYGSSVQRCAKFIQKRDPAAWEITVKISDSAQAIRSLVRSMVDLLGQADLILMAHDAGEYIGNRDFRSELQNVKEEFELSGVGVSIYERDELVRALDFGQVDKVQIPMNILDKRLLADSLLNEVKASGIEVEMRSVFLQGLMFLSEAEIRSKFLSVLPTLKKLTDLASDGGITLRELALLWVANLDVCDKVVIGVNSSGQLEENIRILQKKLSHGLWDRVRAIEYDDVRILDPRKWN